MHCHKIEISCANSKRQKRNGPNICKHVSEYLLSINEKFI